MTNKQCLLTPVLRCWVHKQCLWNVFLTFKWGETNESWGVCQQIWWWHHVEVRRNMKQERLRIWGVVKNYVIFFGDELMNIQKNPPLLRFTNAAPLQWRPCGLRCGHLSPASCVKISRPSTNSPWFKFEKNVWKQLENYGLTHQNGDLRWFQREQ